MRLPKGLMMLGVVGLLVAAGMALPETKVEVKGVHLCCKACVKGVDTALKGVAGAKGTCDREAGTITLIAPDAATAQKALDALAAAGYHGETGSQALAIKDDSGAAAGKVKGLTLTGLHNCCRSCNNAIKDAIKSVPGVTGDTAKVKSDTVEVTGDFDAAALVKSLNAAGFHVKVKR